MSEVDYSVYSRSSEHIETTHRVAKPLDGKPIAKISQAKPTVQERPVKPTAVDVPLQEPQTIHDLEAKLESISVDSSVIHKDTVSKSVSLLSCKKGPAKFGQS